MTTRRSVVQRFLLLHEGDPCSELRRAESERILRAQPFLADASVRTYPDSGGVRLLVTTVDELSILAGLATRGTFPPRPTVLVLGDANFQGSGTHVVAEWRDGRVFRDTWGARFVDYQFLGRPYQLEVLGKRRALGSEWRTEMSHAFLTDLQRVAWRVNAGGLHQYVAFLRPEGDAPVLSLRRRFYDVGGILRIGQPGRLSLFGASISREREETAMNPLLVTDTGLTPAPDPEGSLTGRYGNNRSARLNALWGVRSVRFLRVRGFDALTASQDVRVGLQLGTLLGRGLSVFGSEDDDIFVSLDAYVGMGTPFSFAAVEVRGQGRQNYDANNWDDILASGRAAWYLKLSPRRTLITSAEMTGGWRQRVPFQLSLADIHGGVRGYRASHAAGAQRVVARSELRVPSARLSGVADLGLAAFADAGRLWAGDAPYGANTPIKAGIGISLLAAVPPRSRRLWRMDLAVPVSADPRAKRWELRLSSSNRTRQFWREPDDVIRSREHSVPSSIFTWP